MSFLFSICQRTNLIFDGEDHHDEAEEEEGEVGVDEESLDNKYYDLHARDVKLEDITSSVRNANILRGLRDNNAKSKLEIFGYEECEYADDDNDEVKLMEMDKEQQVFIDRERDHIGWLAYFLSKDKAVKSQFIHTMPKAEIGMLMNGIKHNIIRRFDLFDAEIDCDALAHFIVHKTANSNRFGYGFLTLMQTLHTILHQLSHNVRKKL